MENGGEAASLGYRQTAGVKENFFQGSISLAAITGKELSQDEVWALKEAVNAYYGLSL